MNTTKIIKSFFLGVVLISFSAEAQTKKWTLEECVNYAMEKNISIRNTTLDGQLSEIAKKDAVGNFLPSINAQATHSWNIGLNFSPVTNQAQTETTQFTSGGINANIDIYKGLQNHNQLRKANLSIIASKYQLTKMQEDVSLNVVNAYLQIIFNKENLKVQQEQLAYDNKQLLRSQELVDAGVVPKGDLLDVKATVAADNQRLIAAENTLLISKLSLAQLLQLDNFQEFDIADASAPVAESTILMQEAQAIVDKAKENRTDIKLAATNVDIAERDLKIARGGYYPSLTGFYGLNSRVAYADVVTGYDPITFEPISTKAPPFFDQVSDNKGHNFGVSLNIPILNGFSVKNNVARSKVALERSKISLEQAGLDLERTVYTAYADTKGALKAYEAALSTLESREQAFNYAKDRYEVGLMNVFDLNQSQVLYVNAQSEVLRTKYDYIFRTKILEFYFGIPIVQKQ